MIKNPRYIQLQKSYIYPHVSFWVLTSIDTVDSLKARRTTSSKM
jgi:hypothetical protein